MSRHPLHGTRRERVKGAVLYALRMNFRRIIRVSFFILILAGCARTPMVSPPKEIAPPFKEKPGIYHKVVKGETLWRISKTYGVELEKIVAANRISDVERIAAGQMLFIPSATKPIETKLTTQESNVKEDFIWPVKGKIILYFGAQKGTSPNKGIDIQAREGATVVASRSGKVIFFDDKVKGYGKTLILDHGDELQTLYAHNSESLVKIGDEVKQFTPIAKVGTTGRARTPYLHFEIRKRHQPQNPFYYLP